MTDLDRRQMMAAGLAAALGAVGVASVAPPVAAQGACDLGTASTAIPASCPLFPPDNIWNTPIDALPVDANSDAYIVGMGTDIGLHPDFGSGLYEGVPIGIPFVVVPADQPLVDVVFDVPDESDPGPYPTPEDAPIEGGSCGEGDRHVLVLQEGTCRLFELFDAHPQPDGSWTAFSGAVFDMTSNDLRPDTWTSADAAGFAILPGLVRYDEVEAGAIAHALRFTASTTRDEFVWPARHRAGATDDPDVVPMGQRFRLKADIDIAAFSPSNRVILQALKTYGMFLADNGSDWFLSGTPDDRWDNDDLRALQDGITGADFEAVDCTSLMADPDSGQAG